MNEERLKIIVEAALLAAGRAMTVDHLMELFATDPKKPERSEMRAVLVVVVDIGSDHASKVTFIDRDHMVQAIPS